MHIGLLTLYLHFPGSFSLKDKRSRVKPLLSRLHREFNVSASEIDMCNSRNESVIACVVVSNDPIHSQQFLQNIIFWLENSWLDVEMIDSKIESR